MYFFIFNTLIVDHDFHIRRKIYFTFVLAGCWLFPFFGFYVDLARTVSSVSLGAINLDIANQFFFIFSFASFEFES